MLPFAVVQFPGTNCERETARVLRDLSGSQVDILWHADAFNVSDYGCIVLPGDFAYGDHLRAGAIARFSPILRSVEAFARAGGLVLGICNGFQVLLEAGLLPGAMQRNAQLQFRSRWVHCRVERTDTPFTRLLRPGQVLRLPIAHGEGNYTVVSEHELATLDRSGGVLLRYCDPEGRPVPEANPNGAVANIAGITNPEGNVFGLMPHPERASEALLGSEDGRQIFASILATIRELGPPPARPENWHVQDVGHGVAGPGVTAVA